MIPSYAKDKLGGDVSRRSGMKNPKPSPCIQVCFYNANIYDNKMYRGVP